MVLEAPVHSSRMCCKREIEETECADIAAPTKKRRPMSNTERLAVEISKIHFSHEIKCSLKIEKLDISFSETSQHFQRNQCTWRDSRSGPCYCEKAKLKFESYLQDRCCLIRFSIRCPSCYDEGESAVHLYCAYCDEVLTGTIAGPGGKVSDHLITIRHIYRQAVVLKENLESRDNATKMLSQARDFVSKFEEWSKKARYSNRNSVKQYHSEAVLKELRVLLKQFGKTPESPVCLHITF
jgi:hypothetical protein